jgi:hypothetical protein
LWFFFFFQILPATKSKQENKNAAVPKAKGRNTKDGMLPIAGGSSNRTKPAMNEKTKATMAKAPRTMDVPCTDFNALD